MKKIIIPQEEVNYLQKLNYEIEARKNLCQFLIRQNIRNKAFDDYHNEYIELFAEYELAKLELENNYNIKIRESQFDFLLQTKLFN